MHEKFSLFGVIEKIKTPLTLGGVALLILYYICDKILSLKIFANLDSNQSVVVLLTILTDLFYLAIVAVILGTLCYLVNIGIVLVSGERRSSAKLPTLPYGEYREDIYKDVLWTWRYDRHGEVINLVGRCPEHKSPVKIYATGRDLHPATGQPFRGYTVVCPTCGATKVDLEPLSMYMALDRNKPPQEPLEAKAKAFIEGKIASGQYALAKG